MLVVVMDDMHFVFYKSISTRMVVDVQWVAHHDTLRL